MGRALFSFLLGLDSLLVASASKLLLPPVPTQTEDGAFANVQHPAPTAAPEYYASAELLRRYDMGHDTCGFGALDPGITYKCYSDVGTCENIGSYRGCCTSGLKACSSTFWTQCDDYNPTSVCGSMSHTRCCQSALPYCISWLLSTSDSTVTAWDCDSQSETQEFELLATPLSLISSTSSTSSITTDDIVTSASSSETSDTESTSGLSATSDSTTASSTATVVSSTDSNSTSTSNSSATPVGAIVGGVVGGVAVIALIVLGVLFLKRYQRGGSKTPSPPPAPSGPQELHGSGIPPPNVPTTQGYYAPGPQYDFAGQPKYQEPMAQTMPVEAPNTPAAGTGYNRAELG